VAFLERGFAHVFARAGLGQWLIPSGCDEPPVPLKIQRVAAFGPAPPNVGAGTAAAAAGATAPAAVPSVHGFDDGVAAGLVRIFPASAGSFDAIKSGIVASMPGAPQPSGGTSLIHAGLAGLAVAASAAAAPLGARADGAGAPRGSGRRRVVHVR
jgi:hypothetical protein